MQDFLRNWVAHVRRAGIANVLVGAFDAATVSLCRELDLPHVSSLVWEYEGMATGGASLHSDNAPVIRHSAPLHALGILRAQLLVQLLARGHSVFVSDVDTVWLRDPADFLASHSSAAAVDVALGNDCVSVSGDEEREGWLNSQLNVGLVFLRPTPRALELVARWQGQLERPGTAHVNDQDLMWRVLQQLKHVSREGPWRFSVRMPTSGRAGDPSAFFTAEEAPHLLGSADGSGGAAAVPMPASAETYKGVNGLVLGVLPVALFMGGHPYFWQRLHERPGAAQPIVVHATFQFSHSHGKRQRFREEGLWLADPPEYYSGPNYLTFEPEEPAWEEIERAVVERRREERERAGDASAAGEPSDAAGGTDSLALIDRHMLQAHLHRLETYNALALSRALNRTLILPPLWSRHLHGEPYRVGVDYYFDWGRLQRAFPRVREAAYLRRAFPSAAAWPPDAWPLFFVQLHAGEQLCHERTDAVCHASLEPPAERTPQARPLLTRARPAPRSPSSSRGSATSTRPARRCSCGPASCARSRRSTSTSAPRRPSCAHGWRRTRTSRCSTSAACSAASTASPRRSSTPTSRAASPGACSPRPRYAPSPRRRSAGRRTLSGAPHLPNWRPRSAPRPPHPKASAATSSND